MRAAASRSAIVRDLRALGVEPGGVLLVHTSFRGIGPVDGGPLGLIDALTDALGPEGTLVMPSWPDDEGPFDRKISAASRDLGIVAETFWRLPGAERSDHIHAFAARGPQAAAVLRDPLPLPPHIPASPVGRVHDLDGQVLLLGVNHDANTTIHLAEILAGVPYRVPKHCVVVRNGTPDRIDYAENDHCCARFVLVDDWLRIAGRQTEGVVGGGPGRLARSRAIVEVVVPRLQADPLLFLHEPAARCAECDEARSSVSRAIIRDVGDEPGPG